MPSQYWGVPAPLDAFLPTPKNIASSTNASPIVVTTSSPHGMKTGDSVMIHGHSTNAAANGSWRIVVLSTTTFRLLGSTGSGIGTAVGTAHLQGFGSGTQLPSAGDDLTVASVNVPLEYLLDRTAELYRLLGWDQNIYAGGSVTFAASSSLVMLADSSATIHGSWDFSSDWDGSWAAGSVGLHLGQDRYVSGSEVDFETNALLDLQSGSKLRMRSGIDAQLAGTLQVEATGIIDVEDHGSGTSGKIKIRANGKIEVSGQVEYESGGTAEFTSGSTLALETGSLFANGGETVRTGPLNLSGDDACSGVRFQKWDGDGGHIDGDQGLSFYPHRWNVISVAAITANRVWRMLTPGDSFQASCAHQVRLSRLGNSDNKLEIKDDDSGDTIFTFEDAMQATVDFIWDVDDAKWRVTLISIL